MANSKLLKPILDPCSGSRMFYVDREDPRVIFGDIREIDTRLKDASSPGGYRELHIHPDMLMDFRELPFEDGTFPPSHLRPATPTQCRGLLLAGEEIREASGNRLEGIPRPGPARVLEGAEASGNIHLQVERTTNQVRRH